MTRVMNFSAGPAALPLQALERARDELLDFDGSGMSVMEQSHRGKAYEAVHNEAKALLAELTGLSSDYEILFLQGGASMQFAQLPMNMLNAGQSADYVVNGVWGEKAIGEAKVVASMYGAKTRVAGTTAEGEGKAVTYRRVPLEGELSLDEAAAYVHVTSNETIHGVQFAVAPDAPFPSFGGAPLVCDMSSDFLWRKVDLSGFAFVYAGAQKNIGPSGLCVCIARKDFIAKGRKDIPKIFRYDVAAENNSLFNTPPTFSIYLMRNVLLWAKEQGGLDTLEKSNRAKANTLYGVIDELASFYSCPVDRASRSVMNVVFRMPTEALEDAFVAEAKKAGMSGLKGHRSVGGIRVSTYNAVSLASVETLAGFMREFAKRRA